MKIECVEYMLVVTDPVRAATFWRGLLAMDVRSATTRRVELVRGALALALVRVGDAARSSSTGLALDVDDLDAACARVARHGGEVRGGPSPRASGPRRLAWVADPDGNHFMLRESAHGSAPAA